MASSKEKENLSLPRPVGLCPLLRTPKAHDWLPPPQSERLRALQCSASCDHPLPLLVAQNWLGSTPNTEAPGHHPNGMAWRLGILKSAFVINFLFILGSTADTFLIYKGLIKFLTPFNPFNPFSFAASSTQRKYTFFFFQFFANSLKCTCSVLCGEQVFSLSRTEAGQPESWGQTGPTASSGGLVPSEHGPATLFTHRLWLPLRCSGRVSICNRDSMPAKPKIFIILPFVEKVCTMLAQKGGRGWLAVQ